MANDYLLGIDIGTSGCKIAVFTKSGEVRYQKTVQYETYYPSNGYAEQNPEEWWRAVCSGIESIFVESAIKPGEIKGIGVDGQSGSAIPVDQNGNALRNAIIWLDQRSSEQYEELKRKIDEVEIFSVSGNPLAPSYTTGKILWIKKYEPSIYKATKYFLQSNSFIVTKLTGKFTHDYSQGNGMHMFNIEKGSWDYELSEKMGINPDLLPSLYECSDVVGEVTTQAAKECGLIPGIPVVAGGLDAACGTLGVGAINVGETQEQGGQAGGMSIVMDHAVKDQNLILSRHVVPDKWILQGGTVGGGSLKWFKSILTDKLSVHMDGDLFDMLSKEAEVIPACSNGLLFLQYMAGERSPIWDVEAKGVFLGLAYDKTRAHMVRAIMEGCAFALQHNLETAENSGVPVHMLYSMGGAANSVVWSQIKADVTGKIVKIPSSDTATTLGAAILAGVGTGMYKDFHEAVKATIQFKRVHTPNMQNNDLYQKRYQIYLETYKRLKDLYPILSR